MRFERIVTLVLGAIAALTAAGMTAAAVHDASQAWDVWAYHLPFAGRILGIVPRETYAFGAENAARFAGFPLLGEALQGIAWRLSGRPEGANLVALASAFAIPIVLRRRSRVPPQVTWLALLGVPLVQIHATSAYVDLPANVALTLLLLLVHRVLVTREAPPPRTLAAGALLAATAANMKFQLLPAVLAASLVLLTAALRFGPDRASRVRVVLLAVAAAPIVFATPLKNLVVHGNPVFPVELRVLGRTLPFVETAYASSPAHLLDTPRALRFVRSILELDLGAGLHGRWSIDQWTPPSDPGYRMGGFFGAYVALNLVALAAAVVVRRTREARVGGALVLGTFVFASLMPQSHELRYYLHPMLLLVSLNLVSWWDLAGRARITAGLSAAGAFAVVACATRGAYLYPSGERVASLVATRVDASIVDDATRTGSRICVAREPWTFLYAPVFHPGKRFSVQEATRDEDCRSPR